MATDMAVQQPKREMKVVEDNSALSNLLDTARFEHLQRIASTMANGSLTPKHLKGHNQAETIANCFRVVNQALRWGFDPFAVADETYVVGGKLGYQGKLVAAVINTRSGLVGRLRCEYRGTGMERTVTVIGFFEGELEPRTIELVLKNAKTANDMWTKDPDQKLWYSGAIKWARRHCPEVVMGVLTDDDLERIKEANTIDAAPARPKNLSDFTEQLEAKQDDTNTIDADPQPAPESQDSPAPTLEPMTDAVRDWPTDVENYFAACATTEEVSNLVGTMKGPTNKAPTKAEREWIARCAEARNAQLKPAKQSQSSMLPDADREEYA